MPRTTPLNHRPASAPSAARARLHGASISYASSRGLDSQACRHAVTLLQALEEPLLAVDDGQGVVRGRLLAVAPLVERHLLAANVPLLLVDVEPTHPHFRTLQGAMGTRGVRCLDHLGFGSLRSVGRAFLADALNGRELDRAVRHALGELAAVFDQPPPLDTRVQWMMDQIQEDPSRTLQGLAQRLGLSVEHASRLFSGQLGLPLRVYTLSAKIRLAARYMGRGMSLTDVAQMAGFVDSAHFAKVWLRCYGAPPSAFFPPARTRMDDTALAEWAIPPQT